MDINDVKEFLSMTIFALKSYEVSLKHFRCVIIFSRFSTTLN